MQGVKMVAEAVHTESLIQIAGRGLRGNCAKCGLEVPISQWIIPLKVVENNTYKML